MVNTMLVSAILKLNKQLDRCIRRLSCRRNTRKKVREMGCLKFCIVTFWRIESVIHDSPPPPTASSKGIFDQAFILGDTLVFVQ
jgi:hypothetical protein